MTSPAIYFSSPCPRSSLLINFATRLRSSIVPYGIILQCLRTLSSSYSASLEHIPPVCISTLHSRNFLGTVSPFVISLSFRSTTNKLSYSAWYLRLCRLIATRPHSIHSQASHRLINTISIYLANFGLVIKYSVCWPTLPSSHN